MEIGDYKCTNQYSFIHGNSGTSWYGKHKRKLWVLLLVSCIALVIVIIAVSVKCLTCRNETSHPEYLTDIPELQWDGVCPRSFSECPNSSLSGPSLLIVSLDGFRVEYLNRGLTPSLARIAECGAKADFMYPVFPSKTFPNHYTIVTGLYPESHGIIDNSMHDAELKKFFKVGRTPLDDSRWWQKEPLWVTAKKQGKKTATYFWPGSDVKINGSYPDNYENYNTSIPFEMRVDQVLAWLNSSSPPNFLTLYFDQPDTAGHSHGPQSQEVNVALRNVDAMVNRLLHGLQTRNLTNCVNIIIVSDHGMSLQDCDRAVNIQKFINTSTVYSNLGAFGRIRPIENITSVENVVDRLQCQDSHVRVYRKEELPIRMHYADNARIEPIILEIDAGYSVVDQDVKPGDRKCSGGVHGYDNVFSDMRSIFFSYGPSFKTNVTIRPFLNLELYELMCEVIDIVPNPNNGTRGSLHAVLKDPRRLPAQLQESSPPAGTVPLSQQEIESRAKESNCPCFRESEEEYLTEDMRENRTSLHLPFGIPLSSEDRNDLRILYNNDYILVHHNTRNFPLWVSFTLNRTKLTIEEEICWFGDPRVRNATCAPMPEGFLRRPLFNPEFSDLLTQREAVYVTNSIPKSVNHTNHLEEEINSMIEKRVSQWGPTNVLMGPAFDPHLESTLRNSDSSLIDGSLVMPTHIFVIFTCCTTAVDSLKECDPGHLDAHSFLLPNFPYPDNCQTAEQLVKKNEARVVDIEKLTDLKFYTGLTPYEAVRLRTSMPQLPL